MYDIDLSLIVAMTPECVIGVRGKLPWGNIPSDMARFARITTGVGTVVMGSKTFRSILDRNGIPLKNRKHIVLSRNALSRRSRDNDSIQYVSSAEEAYAKIAATEKKQACIIGGEEIYRLFLPEVGRAYVTTVFATLSGDAFFPDFGAGWVKQDYRKEPRPVRARWNPRDEYETTFAIYERPEFNK